MKGKIYVIYNKINNKKYIGQTIQDVKKRFQQHLQLRQNCKNQLIFKAIQKYGKENFGIKILKNNINNYNDLNYYEEYYIKKYNTLIPNGYNMCPGGQKWRRAPINIDKTTQNKIIDEYKNGFSSRNIGKRNNLSHNIVLKILRKNNIEIRNKNFNLPNRKSKITKEMLLMFDLEKFSNIKIAKELNVDEASIRRAKKRYNL